MNPLVFDYLQLAIIGWPRRAFLVGDLDAALIVGCGLGDDAEWFAARGFKVTAFDISSSAISECCRRFPGSSVNYLTADLFEIPPAWVRGFDLVVESYTLQVLPRLLRDSAIANICGALSPGGYLLLIARARDESDSHGSMPWPLTREETRQFLAHGLEEIYFEDYLDNFEDPPVRRFRGCFQKQA